MARRTRRNISDKRIREIIKEQLEQGKEASPRGGVPQRSASLRMALYGAGFLVLVAVLFLLLRNVDFSRFSERASTPVAKNQQTASATGNQSSPEQSPPEPAPEDLIQPVTGKPQVEVLNGCGVNKIAHTTSRYLRKQGFDVVYFGNYKRRDVDKSLVISRTGHMEIARKLAEVLGIPPERTKKELNPSKQLEASVILGKDYKTLKPFLKK